MNSLLKSVGKICPVGALVLVLGCASPGEQDGAAPSAQVREELQGEISLKKDREELAELRKSIPDEKREANDEVALITDLMVEAKMKPSDLQSRFQQLVQKRRAKFQKKVTGLRDSFRRLEKQSREEFQKSQEEKRREFKSRKEDRDTTRKFYADLDRARLEHSSVEKDRRTEFESEVQAQTKDFDAYMRERTKEFSEQMQLYSKRYHEVQKELSEKSGKNSSSAQDPKGNTKAVMKEFEEMKNKKGTPIGSDGP